MKFAWKLTAFLGLVLSVIGLLLFAMQYRVSKQTLVEPERFVAHVASADDGPEFTLNEDDTHYRFVTFLHIPRTLSSDLYVAEDEYRYHLDFDILEYGEVVATKRIAFKTEKSKIWDPVTGVVNQPAFYTVGIELGEPADSRYVDVDFSQYVGAGRTVRLRSDSEFDEDFVSVLAYRRYERLPEKIEARVRWRNDAEALSNRVGLREWSLVTDAEMTTALRFGWARKTPLKEVATRVLFVNEFSGRGVARSLGEVVQPGAAVTYTVKGPVTLRLLAIDSKPITLDVERLAADSGSDVPIVSVDRSKVLVSGLTEHRAVVPSLRQSNALEIAVPDGVVETVVVRSASPVKVLAWVDALSALVGETPFERIATRQWRITPDKKRMTVWPVVDELEYTIGLEGFQSNDAVVVGLRRGETSPALVRYEFTGTDVSGDLVSSAPFSEIDRISWTNDDDSRRVSRADTFRIPVPKGALSIVLTTEAPRVVATVSLLQFSQTTPAVRRRTYDDAPVGLTWRHAPFLSFPWFRVRPDDAAQREVSGRYATLVGQVRMEPKLGVEADFSERRGQDIGSEMSGTFTTVSAGGRSRELWERTDSTTGAIRYEVAANTDFVCESEGRFNVYLFSRDRNLGAPVRLFWNSEIVRRNVLRTTSNKTLVRASGRGTVRIDAPQNGARFFVDCKPTKVARIYKVRKVYPVNDLATVLVGHDEAQTTWLNVTPYSNRDTLQFQTEVDRGSPPPSTSPVRRLLSAQRKYEVTLEPVDAFFRDTPFEAVRFTGRFGVPIGGNWASGRRRVDLRNVSEGTPVWVRFFIRE